MNGTQVEEMENLFTTKLKYIYKIVNLRNPHDDWRDVFHNLWNWNECFLVRI